MHTFFAKLLQISSFQGRFHPSRRERFQLLRERLSQLRKIAGRGGAVWRHPGNYSSKNKIVKPVQILLFLQDQLERACQRGERSNEVSATEEVANANTPTPKPDVLGDTVNKLKNIGISFINSEVITAREEMRNANRNETIRYETSLLAIKATELMFLVQFPTIQLRPLAYTRPRLCLLAATESSPRSGSRRSDVILDLVRRVDHVRNVVSYQLCGPEIPRRSPTHGDGQEERRPQGQARSRSRSAGPR